MIKRTTLVETSNEDEQQVLQAAQLYNLTHFPASPVLAVDSCAVVVDIHGRFGPYKGKSALLGLLISQPLPSVCCITVLSTHFCQAPLVRDSEPLHTYPPPASVYKSQRQVREVTCVPICTIL